MGFTMPRGDLLRMEARVVRSSEVVFVKTPQPLPERKDLLTQNGAHQLRLSLMLCFSCLCAALLVQGRDIQSSFTCTVQLISHLEPAMQDFKAQPVNTNSFKVILQENLLSQPFLSGYPLDLRYFLLTPPKFLNFWVGLCGARSWAQ